MICYNLSYVCFKRKKYLKRIIKYKNIYNVIQFLNIITIFYWSINPDYKSLLRNIKKILNILHKILMNWILKKKLNHWLFWLSNTDFFLDLKSDYLCVFLSLSQWLIEEFYCISIRKWRLFESTSSLLFLCTSDLIRKRVKTNSKRIQKCSIPSRCN